ncbi:permease [bacterium]|nr:MAG: permease [bacterium]
MSTTAVFINLFALLCLVVAFLKNRQKTKRALVLVVKSFLGIFPSVLTIIIVIGLILGFIPQSHISKIVGEQAGFWGIIIIGLLGAFLHIPSLVSFPLAASLLQGGAAISSVAVFITTLTMIGMVTLPLEIRELGKKFALMRNGMSFVIAIVIGVLIGIIL